MTPAFAETEVGTSTQGPPITVTAAHFEAAGTLFSDLHPLHHDDDYARARGHKGRTLPGSVIGGIMSSSLAVALSDFGLALLEYRVRYKAPVYEGDVLTARCIVVRTEAKPERGGGLVFFETFLDNQDGLTVALGSAVDLVSNGPQGASGS